MGTITNAYKKAWPVEDVLDEIGVGWHPLVAKLIENLFEAGWDGYLHQVKEKFGGLRFYTGDVNKEQNDLIKQAEKDSWITCEVCGEPGKLRGGGWLRTLCDKHAEGKPLIPKGML